MLTWPEARCAKMGPLGCVACALKPAAPHFEIRVEALLIKCLSL